MSNGEFISKKESIMFQGIAVMFMVFHHLFGFPERIRESYFGLFEFDFIHLETILAYFGRICVAMFIFSSGYGMTKMMMKICDEKGKYIFRNTIKKSFNQLKKFYIRYWIICLIFIPIGLIKNIYSFNILQLIKNILGIASTYNKEWWYVSYYLKFMICFPFLFIFFYKVKISFNDKILGIVSIVCMGLCFLAASNNEKYAFGGALVTFILAMVCVLCSVFEKITMVLKRHRLCANIFVGSIFLIAVMVRLTTSEYDFLVAMIFAYSFSYYFKSKYFPKFFEKILIVVGKKSTYIWLLHTFFAYYYWQRYLYAFRLSWLIFIVCIFICIICGNAIEYLLDIIQNKLLKRRNIIN